MSAKQKTCMYIVVVVVAAAVGIYLWKLISENNLRRNMENQRIVLTERAQLILENKTHDLLNLMTVPFVWAVRKEMIRENYDQINEYLTQFVKNREIKNIVVVDTNGIIAVATDKKQEGKSFSMYYQQEYLGHTEINIVDDSEGNIQIVAPIMGLNRRIGTLLITFVPEKINLEVP